MNEYDLINCYLNLIYDNSVTYFSRILDGYRGLCQFRKWMYKRNININAIENIEQYDYEHDSKLRDFCDEMAKYCDGHSCEKVLNIVLKED